MTKSLGVSTFLYLRTRRYHDYFYLSPFTENPTLITQNYWVIESSLSSIREESGSETEPVVTPEIRHEPLISHKKITGFCPNQNLLCTRLYLSLQVKVESTNFFFDSEYPVIHTLYIHCTITTCIPSWETVIFGLFLGPLNGVTIYQMDFYSCVPGSVLTRFQTYRHLRSDQILSESGHWLW